MIGALADFIDGGKLKFSGVIQSTA